MPSALAPRPAPAIAPSAAMEEARRLASPRHTLPGGRPWPALLIHGGLTLIWLALLARALWPDGLGAWTAGLVYIAYDTGLLLFVFWKTLPLAGVAAPAARADRRPHARPSLAVVVAAHDEDVVLAATLNALLSQSEPPEHILVADDGSGALTVSLLSESFGLPAPEVGGSVERSRIHPALGWLRLPQGGKAAALNRALCEIGEEVVLTVDADTLVDRDAVRAMRDAFAADPGLVAATGVLMPVCAPTPVGRLFEWFQTYEYLRNFLSRYAWSRVDSLLLISGAFAGFRRDALIEVGGFDPDCLVLGMQLHVAIC